MNYRKLRGYSEMQRGFFCGISKTFYPKWQGWSLIEAGADRESILVEADSFYQSFYYYPLRLDLLKDQELAFVLLQFAVDNGKKKLKDKLGVFVKVVDEIDNLSKAEILHLILELMEFYYYIGEYSKCIYLMNYYRVNS